MSKRWRIATHDVARTEALERAAGVPAVVARLLLGRGIATVEQVQDFLAPRLSGLRDPHLLPGVIDAARLLHEAISYQRRIVIYGDYDADGMTSTSILLRCFRSLGANVGFYIPHRMDEGYGLNEAALESLAEAGAQTIVTVDNGIASLAAAECARRLGMQLIVTDHHQLADRLPAAAAIVHPALPGHDYPFHGLCGAGVAFKLAWAVCQLASEVPAVNGSSSANGDAAANGSSAPVGNRRVSDRMRSVLLQSVGLAAIGSVADVVPLVDENRILVRHGLLALRQYPLPGIVALEKVCRLAENPGLTGEDIAFGIAPRLNAAGRLGQAELAIELLTTDDPQRAAELAEFLDELNATRQSLERSVLLAARKQAKHEFDIENDPAFVLADRDWHPGVIGIVAGKLAEQYGRPVVLVTLDKLGVKLGVGSGRSAPGFDLAAAFAHCAEYLTSHGGHAAAAGLRIEETQLEAFRIDFCAYAQQQREAADGGPELLIDAETPLAALTHETVTQIEQLAPFGCGNERPVLCTTDVRLASPPRRLGNSGRHLSLELEQHGVKLRAMAFGAGDREAEFTAIGGSFSIAFKPIINTFRGMRRVEMHLEDWRGQGYDEPP